MVGFQPNQNKQEWEKELSNNHHAGGNDHCDTTRRASPSHNPVLDPLGWDRALTLSSEVTSRCRKSFTSADSARRRASLERNAPGWLPVLVKPPPVFGFRPHSPRFWNFGVLGKNRLFEGYLPFPFFPGIRIFFRKPSKNPGETDLFFEKNDG